MLPLSHSNCIDACRDCIAACEAWLERAPAANRDGQGPEDAENLCQSSIQLCRLVIEELKVRSAFSIQVCALGSVICRACAEECAAAKEAVAQACATACQRAAEECRAVATMAGSASA